MHYSKTLRETHEREFLRHKKITADGSDLELDPRDLFALIELDKRTDRVLPNGLCMLPPRQACNRGNACLTCDKFTTDASYLPEHEQQLAKLNELIAQRQAAFRARTGEEMSGSNVWLEQRLTEQRALETIITVLTRPAARRAPRPGGARPRHRRPRRQPARRGPGRVRALLIPAFGPVEEVEQDGLGDLQRLVDGHIEALPVHGREDAAAYVNEEGLLEGLPDNARATLLLGIRIAGPAVLCGFDRHHRRADNPSLTTSPRQYSRRAPARTATRPEN